MWMLKSCLTSSKWAGDSKIRKRRRLIALWPNIIWNASVSCICSARKPIIHSVDVVHPNFNPLSTMSEFSCKFKMFGYVHNFRFYPRGEHIGGPVGWREILFFLELKHMGYQRRSQNRVWGRAPAGFPTPCVGTWFNQASRSGPPRVAKFVWIQFASR